MKQNRLIAQGTFLPFQFEIAWSRKFAFEKIEKLENECEPRLEKQIQLFILKEIEDQIE